MVDRIQITKPTYMNLDGQWQIVEAGVIDVPSGGSYRGSAVILQETPGALAPHGKATPVRNIVTRK